mmetsp:Transcript_48353/g.35543  ORF Transcript_48353/g.35543 Transcript_48353/m.35543 type:complete len:84 (-) Transcript_48353:445-696(-)
MSKVSEVLIDHENKLQFLLKEWNDYFSPDNIERRRTMELKQERQILDPVMKRMEQIEKMISDQNKELSQMQRMYKPVQSILGR